MGVRWFEWKKLMCHSGGFLLVLIFVLLEILELFFSHGLKISETGRYRPFYEHYLSFTAGKVDREAEQFFSEKDEEFSRAESLLQTIYQKVSSGELSMEEYRFRIGELEQLMEGKKGYDVLYEQYLYARENPQNRYLLDKNAWDALLSEDSLNIGLLVVIMLLALLCFGRENMSEMDVVIRVSAKGERRTAKEKLLLVTLLSAGACMLDFCIKAVFFQWGYGFAHGDYPLQSLEFYSEYVGNISLADAATGIFLFRAAGCVLWGLAVSAAIVGFRKYASSMLATLALMLLPLYGLPQSYMKYFLPGPLGFFIGTGYYRGTASEYSALTGQEVYQFIQVPGQVKILLAAANLFMGLSFMAFILKAYTNHWRKTVINHRTGAFFIAVICMICFAGCSGRGAVAKTPEILYNLDNRYYYESGDYLVYTDHDAEGIPYIAVMEKKSGNTFPLIRDVFRANKSLSSCFYGEGNYIYYMERSFDKKDRYFSMLYDMFSIVRINLDTFESRIVFQDNANPDRALALGLGEASQDAYFYNDVVTFVVRKNRIYFITSDEVCEVNVLSGSKKTLFSYRAGNVAYDGSSFFFLDDMSRLHRYFLENNREEAVCGIAAGDFLLKKDGILYTDREQGAALISFHFDTLEKEVLVQEEPQAFCSDGNNIFYVPKGESVIYELEGGKGNPKKIGIGKAAAIYPFSSYESIFVPDAGGGGMAEYLK